MSKVKFGESDSRIVELREVASREMRQADDAIRKHTRMQRRIRAFYDAIEYVSFSSADDSPIWATNWLDWLLTGVVPVPDEEVAPELVDAETATAEAVPEDQPTQDQNGEPDSAGEPDDEPPAPTAAVA